MTNREEKRNLYIVGKLSKSCLISSVIIQFRMVSRMNFHRKRRNSSMFILNQSNLTPKVITLQLARD